MLPERNSCRKLYKEIRDNLTSEQVLSKSQAICKSVLASKEYESAGIILAYYPLGKEVDCIPVIEQALSDGKRIVLPRTGCDYRMDFYEIRNFFDMEAGTFHVMEPKADCKIFLPGEEADWPKAGEEYDKILVLVPGVVFDRKGNRYGYGKGYYDRYFARFPWLRRMALVYSEQLSDAPLECLKTDIKMHVIVSEDEVIWIDKV